MKKNDLMNHEQMLLALLQASLNETTPLTCRFETASEEDWKKCFQLSKMQGVMALAWEGVMRLPANLLPPVSLKISWAIAVEKYEKKYERYCQTIHNLSTFYAKHGIETIQLKGVGLSSYYPVPSHREGGDIDIYTRSADTSVMTDQEASELADKLMKDQGIDVEMHTYKHSNFYYQGIPIENHKFFVNVMGYQLAAQVDKWLMRDLRPQTVHLQDGKYAIQIPSDEFNTLFVIFHAMQHYGEGISLHHLYDWAVLIKHNGVKIPAELTDRPFLEAIDAMTRLCNEYLGTEVEVMGGKELAQEMMAEIIHPKFPHKAGRKVKGKWNILIYKTQNFFHRAKTRNKVLYVPLWKLIWKSVIAHIRRPDTVFYLTE